METLVRNETDFLLERGFQEAGAHHNQLIVTIGKISILHRDAHHPKFILHIPDILTELLQSHKF